jgi:hypothetical protein
MSKHPPVTGAESIGIRDCDSDTLLREEAFQIKKESLHEQPSVRCNKGGDYFASFGFSDFSSFSSRAWVAATCALSVVISFRDAVRSFEA